MIPAPAADRNRGPVTAESLQADLERAIRSGHLAADPAGVARTALRVVLPHLRAMAGEIERLRDEVAAVRGLAVAGGVRLAELERVRTAARAGHKSGSEEKGRRDG